MKRILIVEDDREINRLLNNILIENGYITHAVYTGLEALNVLRSDTFDMVLLDIMLPIKSGDEVLRQLRLSSNIPVIIISAKDITQTKIDLLRLGADDYITKPFDIDEVIARVEANLRRLNQSQRPQNIFSYQDIQIDCDAKLVTISGHPIALTATEYSILELLIRNPTKVFSKRSLFEYISGEEYLTDDNTMNVHISNIRIQIT